MSRLTRSLSSAVSASMLIFLFTGCAKEPATTMALAPSPGGTAGASASSADESGGAGGVVGRGGVGAGAGQDAVGPGGRRSDFAAGGVGGAGGLSAGGAGTAGGMAAGGVGGVGGVTAGGGGQTVAGQGGSAGMVAAARPQPKEFGAASGLQDIHFDFDRYEIRSEDAQVLTTNAEWLRGHPRALILIEGHCDDRGTNEYNLALGNHRAESALKYLIAQGVPKNRMTTISYGEERPLCTEETEDCWARNRRAHFLVKRQ
jgi:peptidoglycan-associated lipoprotein